MPLCVHCNQPLECETCRPLVQPVGQTAIQCPKLAKGKLWIHVTDDLGVNVPQVPVKGKSNASTDASGMWKWDELEPDTYTAAMMPSSDNLKVYDVDTDTVGDRKAVVKPGVLAYVQFRLIRKATLQVRVVVKSGKNLSTESPLKGIDVPLKVAYTGTGAQPPADDWTWTSDTPDRVVSAGKYTLTPTLSGLSTADYEYSQDPEDVELQPGDSKPIVFEVVKKAELTATFVLKAFGPKFLSNVPFTTTAIPVAVAPKAKGTTDSKNTVDDRAVLKVTPGAYTVTPDFKALDPALFEWKDSQTKDVDITGESDDPVVFEIGRKAKLRVEIVYKHDHTYRLRDTQDGRVDVTLKFLGNEFAPAATLPVVKTTEGVAEFASLSPGEYEIAPAFDQLAECKFDWTPETRKVSVFPDVDDPVVFEVEPLYQQVEFIAHCLMTIPTQKFVASTEDENDRLAITTHTDGTRTFAFKNKRVLDGRWLRTDVNLDPSMAEPLKLINSWILQMKTKAPDDYYTLAELDAQEKAKLTRIGDKIADVPVTYKVTKKPKINATDTDADFGAMAELRYLPSCILQMKPKAPDDYYAPADLDPHETAKIDIKNKIADGPAIYEVAFRDKFQEVPWTLTELTGKYWGKYHGDPDDGKDIAARVSFVKDTLDKALAQVNQHPTVLKVFMVPECFFQGLHGVYLENDGNDLIKKLQEAVQDAKWKDWVFSFGTVNTVKAAPAVNGIVFAQPIYEMQNQAPLIRGGLGSVSGKPSTRMIRKVLNSAELADDLLEDPAKKRKQSINEDVQFMAFPSEIEAGNLLAELLQDEKAQGQYFETQQLLAGLWTNLVDELKLFLGKWGMARVIREIRNARNDKVANQPLDAWTFGAYESRIRDAQTHLVTWQEAVCLLVQAKWKELHPTVPLKKPTWLDNSGKRQAVLQNLAANCSAVSAACGFRLSTQQATLKTKVEGLVNDDAEALALDPSLSDSKPPLTFQPSIFPVWKQLLGLYNTRKGSPAKMDLDKKEFSLDEYCVVGPRKVGPWIDTVSAGKALPVCKRMVFGLEICADHADGRLNSINTGANEIGIDIQLVPSAGMSLKNFATRTGGYMFNCDGWNQAPKGGKTIDILFDGPTPWVSPPNPCFPHSAVGKCESGKGTMVGNCLGPDATKRPALSADLSKVIFDKGPGELHVYPLQPLPQ